METLNTKGCKAMHRLFRYLTKFFKNAFSGKVEIHFLSGRITHVRTTSEEVVEFREVSNKNKTNTHN